MHTPLVPANSRPVIPIVLLIATVLLLSSTAALSHEPPPHELTISFDLNNHRLSGISRINLTADHGITLQLTDLDVTGITLNGNQIEEIPQDSMLQISPSPQAQQLTIAYAKEIAPAENSGNLIGDSGITLTSAWHPTADMKMRFELNVLLPDAFTGVSEADTIVTEGGGNGLHHTRFIFSHPLWSLHFAAGPYVVEETPFGDGKILATYFFAEDQELASQYMEKSLQYLERYEKLLGPYPYQRYAVVENLLPTGFAMPTFSLLGQAVVRLDFIKDISLGHEVVHSWFGNAVEADLSEGNWAEGLTTYLADQAFADDKGEGAEHRKQQLIKYASYVTPQQNHSLVNFVSPHGPSGEKQAIQAVGYGKSSMFFHMVKKLVGEDVFYEGLRDFYKRMAFKEAGWSDIIASFEDQAHLQLAHFFFQWISRADIPGLAIKDLAVNEQEGRPVITFQLLQTTGEPYQLQVPITIITTQGKVIKNISTSEKQTAVEIPVTAHPREMVIDPEYDLMRQLSPAELPPTWSGFAGAENKLAVIASNEEAEDLAPLVEMLKTMGCEIVEADKITDADLAAKTIIFLGASEASRALFADPSLPEHGFVIDIRRNPLNPANVAIMARSDDQSETAPGVRKLRHYGKYSFLHFEAGHLKDKRIVETENGQHFGLIELPMGIKTTTSGQEFASIIDELQKSRVIYVGEGHTLYQDHRLQLQIIRALYEKDPRLAIGMEMFSLDTQQALDDYINRQIDEKEFLKRSEYFSQWRFDYRLYQEILVFARRHRIPVIGLNLDREVVKQVSKAGGTMSLAPEEKETLPPDRDLDIEGYRDRLTAVFYQHNMHLQNGSGFPGFIQAQGLWDETMAATIADRLKAHPEERMVVIAGRGHVLKDTAIPPRVSRRLQVNQAVVLNADNMDISAEQADYIFFSPPVSLPPAVLLGVMLNDNHGDGVLVTGLDPNGSAKKGGIREKDVILGLDDEPTNSIEDVKIVMLYKKRGDSIKVRLKRHRVLLGDNELEITLQL